MQAKSDSNQPKPQQDRERAVRADLRSPSTSTNVEIEKEMQTLALLLEVRDGLASITRSLSAEGFDDIHDEELLVLLTLGRDTNNPGSLLRAAGVADQAVGSITETLLSLGYLERRVDPDNPEQTSFAASKRASGIGRVVEEEFRVQRWARFPFRQGDIVICTPPKSGTTWVQMICALLIFQNSDLPATLPELSPWLDEPFNVRDQLFARLEEQEHRRFLKTHLPLDRIVIDPRATYIVVARHPLDVMLSKCRINLVTDTTRENENSQPELRKQLLGAINQRDPGRSGLPGIMRSWCAAWARRDEPNVILLRYEDLAADLEGQMRGLAARLDITVPEATWPGLVKAATFEEMRADADRIQPLRDIKDPAKFFWKGKPGSGRALLTDDDLARYDERAAELAPADLLAWLNT